MGEMRGERCGEGVEVGAPVVAEAARRDHFPDVPPEEVTGPYVRGGVAPARPPRAHTDQLLLQGVHPESDHGGRLRRLPAHPPQRPRRNVRPAFRPPPPAGDGPSSSSTPSTSVTTE